MKKFQALFLMAVLVASCSDPEPSKQETMINASHLDRLYEEITFGDKTLGTIWIYCEAPDYRLVADEDEGFTCVDDVARALVFYCREYKTQPSPEIVTKIRLLTEFVLFMRAENGFFYNFMLPGPQINETHQNSQAIPSWWTWRAFWALSELSLLESEELADLQSRSKPALDFLVVKMQELCPDTADTAVVDGVTIPACFTELGADQVGVIMIGLANYYQVSPSDAAKNLMLSLGDLLLRMQQGDADRWPYGAFLSWRNYWHGWGNLQAYGLLYAGRILSHDPFIQSGLKEVRHFYPYCLEQNFISGFKVVSTGDSLSMEDFNQFPQIAYNIRPMIYASLEAFIITGDTLYANIADRLGAWLFGDNPAGQDMYDPATGRTFDGISSPEDINRNSGAESTIEALLSLQAMKATRKF